MKNFPNEDLIGLLADDTPSLRMLALHFLSEGYAEHASILPALFTGWDRWGAASAYPEFPLLSYVYIPADEVQEALQRARAMVPGRKLTDPNTRCAGKLVEQVCNLPAAELRDYQTDVDNLVAQSKIFFRIDASAIRRRLELMSWEADQLAQQLDSAIETLTLCSDDTAAFHAGLQALEALRRVHPDYLDMATAISNSPPDNGAQAISFQLSMHSLIQCSQAGYGSGAGQALARPARIDSCQCARSIGQIGNTAGCSLFDFAIRHSGGVWAALDRSRPAARAGTETGRRNSQSTRTGR